MEPGERKYNKFYLYGIFLSVLFFIFIFFLNSRYRFISFIISLLLSLLWIIVSHQISLELVKASEDIFLEYHDGILIDSSFKPTFKDGELISISSKEDDYQMNYKYEYDDGRINKIIFSGKWFGNDFHGNIQFSYIDNEISTLTIHRTLLDQVTSTTFSYKYGGNNHIQKVDIDNGDMTGSCHIYDYGKYYLQSCFVDQFIPTSLTSAYEDYYSYQGIYLKYDLKNSSVWTKYHISPFLYYDLYSIYQDISDPVQLQGTDECNYNYEVEVLMDGVIIHEDDTHSCGTGTTNIFLRELQDVKYMGTGFHDGLLRVKTPYGEVNEVPFQFNFVTY